MMMMMTTMATATAIIDGVFAQPNGALTEML